MSARTTYLQTAQIYVGAKVGTKAHHHIVDVFNQVKPDGWAMTYTAPWCACFASAIAIEAFGIAKAKKYFPLSANCGTIINKAKSMGIWVENDAYKPNTGDWVLYDWDDSGKGDNTGSPDHVGTIKSVSGNTITVIEGNYSNMVKEREISVNGRYIRGFVVPKYSELDGGSGTTPTPAPAKKSVDEIAKEVLAGKWGNGDDRIKRLTQAGYDYNAVQKRVNELAGGGSTSKPSTSKPATQKKVTVKESAKSFNQGIAGTYKTTDALNVRSGAGTNKTVLVTVPKGTKVKCYGYYTSVSGVKWYYVQFTYNNIVYTGFCSSKYLKK